jgi:hypothetical protein
MTMAIMARILVLLRWLLLIPTIPHKSARSKDEQKQKGDIILQVMARPGTERKDQSVGSRICGNLSDAPQRGGQRLAARNILSHIFTHSSFQAMSTINSNARHFSGLMEGASHHSLGGAMSISFCSAACWFDLEAKCRQALQSVDS